MNASSEPRERLSGDEFRDVIGRFASGVTVITTAHDGLPYGTTASAVSSLSLDPPMLLICMNKESATGKAVADAKHFAVNILGEDQPDLAIRFASKGGDKFAAVATSSGVHGDPLIDSALATLECRVTEEATGGTHTVFLAEVDRASARPGSPLAYFRGQFGRLQLEQDQSAYSLLRSRIVERALPIDEPLDLDDLAAQLDAPRGSVYHAFARLSGEGLATRTEAGFVVQPITAAAVESALAARHAILLGVIAQTLGTVDRAALGELRTRLHTISSHGSYGEWRQALVDFQRRLIGLSGSDTLVEVFARANVAAMIASRQETSDVSETERATLLASYESLLDALEAGDAGAANGAVGRIMAQARASASGVFARDEEL